MNGIPKLISFPAIAQTATHHIGINHDEIERGYHMAQKRMLDKKISLSEKVANLDLLGQILYTWMIPHADDFGLLQASARTLKALVVPMIDCTADQVGFQLETMRNTGLILEVTILGKNYYKIVGSERNQTLKKDRNPQTILPVEMRKENVANWSMCEKLVNDAVSATNGIQTETQGFQTETELKGTEEKINNNGESADAPPIVKKNESMNTTKGMSSMKDIIARKTSPAPSPSGGITLEWQEKALRYAKDLNIALPTHARARWMKIFKEASTNERGKAANIEKAYSFIIDYPKPMSNEQKMMFFFKIYERGLGWMKKE